ncbi:histone deacetylase 6-like isoform X2 [Struthio camelus]|uniref:histone deacetylase 6-like isoform X2 n=1 Tax=Struthio camelus TaxID=8801 RepID=UPI0036042F39
MGRAGRRAPRQSPGLPEAKRRGRARRRNREEELEAGLQHLELGAEGPAPTGTGLAYDEQTAALPWPGDESPPLAAAWARLQQYGLVERCVRVEPRLATDEEILLVHSPEALAQTAAAAQPEAAAGARLAAGALLALVSGVAAGELRNGLGLLRPPGGSSALNAVAMAARWAQRRLGVQRVLIVNWDVEPDQSTQSFFEDDPSVLCFSVHRGAGGPPPGAGRARGCALNLPWQQAGMTDGDYLAAFLQLLLPVGLEFQPQLVLVAAGFGALVGHPEGGMRVTPGGFAHLTHLLAGLAAGRLVLSLQRAGLAGPGHGRPPQALGLPAPG